MALTRDILYAFAFVNDKIKLLYEKIFRIFGWKIRYNSVLDCFDWMFFPLTLCGPSLVNRTYINDQVVFTPKKMTPLEYLKTMCFIIYYFVAIYTIIYQRANPPFETEKLVRLIFYSLVPWFSSYVLYLEVSKLKEHFDMTNLQSEIDEAMTQLGLHMDYSLLVIPVLVIMTAIYIVNILAFCIYVYFMINYEFISYFCEITAESIIMYPLAYFVFLFSSIFFIPMIRFSMLSSYLKLQVHGFHLFNELEDDLIPDNLFIRQAPSHIMNTVIFILNKQLEIMNLSLNITSFLFFMVLHVYTLLLASLIYVYIVQGIILYPFLSLVILATPAFTIIIAAAQIVDYLVSIILKTYLKQIH